VNEDTGRELARLANRMRDRNRSARNNASKAHRDGDTLAAAAWTRIAAAHAIDGRDLERLLRRLPTSTTPGDSVMTKLATVLPLELEQQLDPVTGELRDSQA
jgi:hypothetical protein